MPYLNSRLLTAATFLVLFLLQYCNAANASPSTEQANIQPTQATESVSSKPAVKILSLRLLSVDYFAARLELVYEGNLPEITLLYGNIPTINNTYSPENAYSGKNTFIIYIHRTKQKNIPYVTKNVTISFYTFEETLFKDNVKLTINWPGPDSVSNGIKINNANAYDFSSISKIGINHYLPKFNSIVQSLLEIGFPVEKIETHGYTDSIGTALVLGEDINTDITKKLTSLILTSEPFLKFVTIDTNEPSADKHFIAIGSLALKPAPLPEITLSKLRQGKLNNDQFYQLLKFTPKSAEQKIQAMYEQAYNLIDSGNTNNTNKAKAILDDIINQNPNFPRAYLELARYYMRTESKMEYGLERAEKSILIAKDIDPKLADTRVLLGYVYTKQGRFDEADQEYRLAEKLGTDNLWLYANWGLNFQYQEKNKQAIEKYLKVVSKKQTFDRNDRPRDWVYMYSDFFGLLIETEQYQLADSMYQKFSDEYPNNACILQGQAAVRLYYLQKYEDAINSYLKAKKSGCSKDTATIAVAYYMKWFQLKAQKAATTDITSAYRQGDAFTPTDNQLFYSLALSDYTASAIPDIKAQGKNINHVDSTGMTALLFSVSNRQHKNAERLLNNGANINQVSGERKYFPLAIAVYNNDTAMVNLLLKFNADPYANMMSGPSLHDIANSHGNKEIIKALDAHKKT